MVRFNTNINTRLGIAMATLGISPQAAFAQTVLQPMQTPTPVALTTPSGVTDHQSPPRLGTFSDCFFIAPLAAILGNPKTLSAIYKNVHLNQDHTVSIQRPDKTISFPVDEEGYPIELSNVKGFDDKPCLYTAGPSIYSEMERAHFDWVLNDTNNSRGEASPVIPPPGRDNIFAGGRSENVFKHFLGDSVTVDVVTDFDETKQYPMGTPYHLTILDKANPFSEQTQAHRNKVHRYLLDHMNGKALLTATSLLEKGNEDKVHKSIAMFEDPEKKEGPYDVISIGQHEFITDHEYTITRVSTDSDGKKLLIEVQDPLGPDKNPNFRMVLPESEFNQVFVKLTCAEIQDQSKKYNAKKSNFSAAKPTKLKNKYNRN